MCRRGCNHNVRDGLGGYPKTHVNDYSRLTLHAAGQVDETSYGHTHVSTKQPLLVDFLHSVCLGGLPDGQTKPNLVDEIGQVVHEVQSIVIHSAHQVAEEVAQRVDAPTSGDNQSHSVEGCLHVLVNLVPISRHRACLARKNLKQDEPPASHADHETHHGVNHVCLTHVAESQHHDSANQEAPKDTQAEVWLHRRKNQVELNHLQRNCDGPINVAIHDGRRTNLDPELAHVEVMHTRNQCNQSTDVHGRLPVKTHIHGLHQEEHRRSHHCD